jgi:hypothetical protein
MLYLLTIVNGNCWRGMAPYTITLYREIATKLVSVFNRVCHDEDDLLADLQGLATMGLIY